MLFLVRKRLFLVWTRRLSEEEKAFGGGGGFRVGGGFRRGCVQEVEVGEVRLAVGEEKALGKEKTAFGEGETLSRESDGGRDESRILFCGLQSQNFSRKYPKIEIGSYVLLMCRSFGRSQ